MAPLAGGSIGGLNHQCLVKSCTPPRLAKGEGGRGRQWAPGGVGALCIVVFCNCDELLNFSAKYGQKRLQFRAYPVKRYRSGVVCTTVSIFEFFSLFLQIYQIIIFHLNFLLISLSSHLQGIYSPCCACSDLLDLPTATRNRKPKQKPNHCPALAHPLPLSTLVRGPSSGLIRPLLDGATNKIDRLICCCCFYCCCFCLLFTFHLAKM